MQAKTMIIITLVLIGALAIFNVVISHNSRPVSVEASTTDVTNSNPTNSDEDDC